MAKDRDSPQSLLATDLAKLSGVNGRSAVLRAPSDPGSQIIFSSLRATNKFLGVGIFFQFAVILKKCSKLQRQG